MSNWINTIENAKRLLDMGAITREQFEQLRDRALREQARNIGIQNVHIDALETHVSNIEVYSPQPARPPLSTEVNMLETKIGGIEGTLIGSHRIVGLIGQGGMGTVYRGRHANDIYAEAEGDVAIKIIHPSLAKEAAFNNRFVREASMGKRLLHPNIAKVLNFHSAGEQLALIMELIEGQELASLFPSNEAKLSEVLKILKPLSNALDYLHTQGIVHRDMKPANVRVKPDGTPVILDFGIAKDANEVDGEVTQTGTAMGTRAYMAPEQIDAKRVTGSADQYALAMIAYQLLSGRFPWQTGLSAFRIMNVKLNGELLDLKQFSSVSTDVCHIVMKGLSSDVADRYNTCADFIAALEIANGVTTDVSGVKGQFQTVSNDTQNHDEIIDDTVDVFERQDVSEQSSEQIEQTIVFEKVEEESEREANLADDPYREKESEAQVPEKNKPSIFRQKGSTIFIVGLLLSMGFGYARYVKHQNLVQQLEALQPKLELYDIILDDSNISEDKLNHLLNEIHLQEDLHMRMARITENADKYGLQYSMTKNLSEDDVASIEEGVDTALKRQRSFSERIKSAKANGDKYLIEVPSAEIFTEEVVSGYETLVLERMEKIAEVSSMYTEILIVVDTFDMGCTIEQKEVCFSREMPPHTVTLSHNFFMMQSEVTQGLFAELFPDHKSAYVGESNPVERVTWFDAIEFANALSALEGRELCYVSQCEEGKTDDSNKSDVCYNHTSWVNKVCTGWRLPTEAEWEYAARGKEKNENLYAGSSSIQEVAWFGASDSEDADRTVSESTTYSRCDLANNSYDLCDMSGNVWEWVWDGYDFYSEDFQTDPVGPLIVNDVVVRGGSYFNKRRHLRVSSRWKQSPNTRHKDVGFRLIRQKPL